MNLNQIAIFVGLIASIIFLAVSYFYYNKVPTFSQIAVVMLSWAGAIAGFYLIYFVSIADDASLGQLADQRTPIVLGALAVIWTSAESFFSSIKVMKTSTTVV